jgi:hypothetical protein
MGKEEKTLLIPYTEQSVLNSIYKTSTVLSTEYTDEGVRVEAVLDAHGKGLYSAYILS